MRLGPPLFAAVVDVGPRRGVLHGRPADKGVVADKGANVAVCHGKRDAGVDEAGEPGDTMPSVQILTRQGDSRFFEKGLGDVHDARRVLQEGHLGRVLQLADGVHEAVGRHARVRVDEEDVVANATVALGPGASLVLGQHVVERLAVRHRLGVLVPAGEAAQRLELLLDAHADVEGVVHIRRLFELALAHKRLALLGTRVVLWPRDPGNAVLLVKVAARLRLFLVEELHAVVVDEYIGRAALQLVRRDGRFYGSDGRAYHCGQALFVHGHLHRDVRVLAGGADDSPRRLARVAVRVLHDGADGAEDLQDTTNYRLEEELQKSASPKHSQEV